MRTEDPTDELVPLVINTSDDMKLRLSGNPAGTAEYTTLVSAIVALKSSLFRNVTPRLDSYNEFWEG